MFGSSLLAALHMDRGPYESGPMLGAICVTLLQLSSPGIGPLPIRPEMSDGHVGVSHTPKNHGARVPATLGHADLGGRWRDPKAVLGLMLTPYLNQPPFF